MREERAFRRAYLRYLRALKEINFENPEDLASVLAAAEVLIALRRKEIRD